MAGPNWRQVLDAARRLARRDIKGGGGGGFTSSELAREARIGKGPASRPNQIAAAWCGKFKKWGLIASEVNTTEGVRWCRLWQLTDSGWGIRKRKQRRARGAPGR